MLGVGHARTGRLKAQGLGDGRLLQGLQAHQHAPEVGLEDVVAQLQFERGVGHVAGTLLGAVQVQRVHVEALAARGQQVDLEQLERQVLGQAAHAVSAIAQRHRDLVVLDLTRHVFCRSRRHGAGRQGGNSGGSS